MPYYAGAEAWHELVFLGQSNAAGVSTSAVSGLPDSGVRMWGRVRGGSGQLNSTALQSLQVRYDDDDAVDRHGAWAYAQVGEAPTPHHVFMVAEPGTGILEWITGNLIDEYLDHHPQFIAHMGGVPTAHVIWQQGERNAVIGTSQAVYEGNLTTVLANIRSIHGAGTAVHLVLLCEQIADSGIALASIQAINAAMVAVAAGDADCYIVDMSTETGVLHADNLHYSAAGYALVWDKIQTSIAGE